MSSTIGIDVGGTKVAAGRVSADGLVLERLEVATPRDPQGFARVPLELARRLSTREVVAAGMGVAGLVRDGRLVWGPNVAGADVPFGRLLEEALGVPAVIDNDANVAALAEAMVGAGRGHRHVLAVTLGTGIGGGIVVDGRIYRGRGFAGEVGHMVVDPDGPPCPCGLRGCWEQLGSGTALTRMGRLQAEREPEGAIATLAGERPVRGEDVAEAARSGDPAASAILAELAEWIGLGLGNLIAVLDPAVIVVGGGLARLGDLLLDPVRAATGRSLQGSAYRRPPPIVQAALDEEAGIVGAALLAREGLDE